MGVEDGGEVGGWGLNMGVGGGVGMGVCVCFQAVGGGGGGVAAVTLLMRTPPCRADTHATLLFALINHWPIKF